MTLCLRFFECDLQPNNDVLKHRSIPSIRTIGNTITRVLARRRRKILRFLHLKSMISNRKFDYLTSKSPKFSPSAIFKNRKKKHLTPKTASFWDLTPDPRGGGPPFCYSCITLRFLPLCETFKNGVETCF